MNVTNFNVYFRCIKLKIFPENAVATQASQSVMTYRVND